MVNPKGGKPKPLDDLRTATVMVYLTRDEHEAVRTLAAFYATPTSALVRELVLNEIAKAKEG